MNELTQLRQRVAELEQLVAQLTTELEQVRTQVANSAAEAMPYQALFEQLPIPMVLYQPDGLLASINYRNAELLHIPHERVGHAYHVHNLLTDAEALRTGHVAAFQEAVAGSVVQMNPTAYATDQFDQSGQSDDHRIWTATTYFPIRDAHQEVQYVGAINLDVSAYKRIEIQLRMFETLAENAPDAITVCDLEGKITYGNPAYRRLLQLDRNPEITLVADTFAPGDRERLPMIIQMLLTNKIWHDILIYQRTDGSQFPGQASAFTIDDETGTPLAFAAIIRDITAQVEQERELRSFYALAENAPDGIAQFDLDGTISYANPAFQRMTGYGQAMIGMQIAQFHDDTPEQVAHVLQEIVERGLWQQEITYRRKDGSIFLALSSSFAIRDTDGTLLRIVGIIRDVTEQHRAEQERIALQEQVISAQRNALREVQTPLIPLAEEVVAMPLIGTIDSGRAQQILETLLEGVAAYQAEVVILDITGVQVVDTQVASALVRAAKAVKLLGAQVVLTGIRPEVAQTLIGMGADLGDILTLRNLQLGIAYVLAQRNPST